MSAKLPKKIVSNLMILIVAPLLALGLFYFTRYGGDSFLASVLELSELETIAQKGRGIAYKTFPGVLEVFGSELVQDQQRLQFELLYNPEEIQLGIWDETLYQAQILSDQPGYVLIELNDFQDLALDQEWFAITFTGAEDQLLLGEAYTVSEDSSQTPLAVGSLNVLDSDFLFH